MNRNSTKHTLESIATLAGVSRGTVSRVVNNQSGVKPAVRDRIKQIIAETGYIPHPQARSLAGGKSGNIGVIVFGTKPDFLTHHIFYEVLQGIQTQSSVNDYDLLLFSNRSTADQTYWKQVATRRKVDGLIVMGELIQEEYLRYYREQGIPFVLIGKREYDGLPLTCVTSDYQAGVYAAVKHLLAKGRRKIIYIQGYVGTYHENARFAGYQQALLEAGIPLDNTLIVNGGAEQEIAYEQITRLLATNIPFDAIFAANDFMAFGALEALEQQQLSVPIDVSVVGYDDIQAASFYSPPLTTVRQNKKELGEEAIHLLLTMLQGHIALDESLVKKINNDLIIRETT